MPTPYEAQREGFRWLPTVIIGLVVLCLIWAGLSIAGNNFEWWIQKQAIQHTYNNTVNSQGYQDAQIAIMEQRLTNILGPTGLATDRAGIPASSGEQQVLQASEFSEVDYFCAAGAKIVSQNQQFTSGSPSLKQIYAANCTAGTADASPPLTRNPVPDGGA